MTTTVLIRDDSAMAGKQTVRALPKNPDVRLLRFAADGREALQVVERGGFGALTPAEFDPYIPLGVDVRFAEEQQRAGTPGDSRAVSGKPGAGRGYH